jgi:hypothetical protein
MAGLEGDDCQAKILNGLAHEHFRHIDLPESIRPAPRHRFEKRPHNLLPSLQKGIELIRGYRGGPVRIENPDLAFKCAELTWRFPGRL